MKKIVRVLLAILMAMCLVLAITACKSDCDNGNHTWDSGVVTEEATCTRPGVKTFKCTLCDHGEKKEIIPATGNHTPESVSKAATCTEDGIANATKCSVCGAAIEAGTKIEKLGHNVTTWTPVANDDTKHEGTCTREGCGVKVTADHRANTDGTACLDCNKALGGGEQPHSHNFDGTIEANVTIVTNPSCTDKGSKTVKCSGCDEVSEPIEIPALGHDYTGAKWTPSQTQSGKHVRTCTREGCGYIDSANHTPEVVKGTPATCLKDGKGDGSKCSACDVTLTEGAVIGALGHDWDDEWNSSATKHWHDCTRCDARKGEADHNFGEDNRDLTCNDCEHINPNSEFNYVLSYTDSEGQIVRLGYIRLAHAMEYVASNDSIRKATISVGGNDENKVLEGYGVVIPAGHNITINLNKATYVIVSDPVGSTGTETCGFQILAGSTVTINNGTITSRAGSGVKMLIQNYATLTLDAVTLDGSNLDLANNAYNYTLSNNCGTVRIQDKCSIIARGENGVALDVWYNMGNMYPQGVKVRVDETCTITGVIEYGSAQENVADLAEKAVLTLPAGEYSLRYSGNITDCRSTGITIGGKKLTAQFGDWQTDKAPTCTEAGQKSHSCTLCGRTETASIPMLGHTLPTAEYVGGHEHEGVCTVCKKTITAACTEENYACTVCKRELFLVEDVNAGINTSQQGYSNGDEVTSIKNGNLTVAFDKGTNNNSPKYYTTGSAVRLYADGSMTIAVPEGSIITKITFTFDSGDDKNAVTADSGSFNGTVWIGCENSVIFTIGSTKANGDKGGHRRIKTISVEYTYVECNHFYGEWELKRQETCTQDGLKTRTCLDCEVVDSYDIAAHHTLGELVPEDKGSCLGNDGKGKNGHVAYYGCEKCGKHFADAKGEQEISDEDFVIEWKHDMEYHERVAATTSADGTKAYYECKVCHRKYEDKDGKTEIANFDTWVVIPSIHEHTYGWAIVGTEHVYYCTTCQEDATITDRHNHNPEAGAWSGTDVHVRTCAVEGCNLTVASHNAKYATAYTVVDGTYHAQECASCTLVNDKHLAKLSDPVATSDKTKHYQECDDCTYQTEPVPHEVTYTYSGNGKHSGKCECGETIERACTPAGLDNICSGCKRIVGKVENNFDISSQKIGKDHTTTTATSGSRIIFENDQIKIEYQQKSAGSNGNGYYPFRFYANDAFKITAKTGVLTQITISYDSKAPSSNTQINASVGDISNDGRIWEGEDSSVVLTNVNSAQFTINAISIMGKAVSLCYHEGDNVLKFKTATSATCESVGLAANCWHCENCDKYFTSEKCTEIAEDVVIPANGHEYGTLIKARSATCELEEYIMDHYYCEVCGTYFNAEKQKVNQSAVIGSTVDHSWGAWTHDDELNADGNNTHSRTCVYDTNNTHKQTQVCELDWEHDDEYHWYKCTVCPYEDTDSMDEHVMKDGVCETCGYSSTAVSVSVSVSGGDESLVETTLPKQAEVGTSITFTVTVAQGYRLVSVGDYVAGTAIEGTNGTYTYTFTDESVMDGAVLVNITIIKQVTVNLSAVENGTMTVTYGSGDNLTTVTDGTKVDVGTELTITVTPDDGYEVTSVTAGGSTVTGGKYTISLDIAAISITISAEVTPKAAKSWKLVTNVNMLAEGKKIVIVSGQYVAGALSGTYLDQVTGVKYNTDKSEITTLPDGALELTLGKIGDNWTLANSEGDLLGMTATSNNKLSFDSSASGYVGTWTISMQSDNTVMIINTKSSTDNWCIQYNGTNTRFSNYKSAQVKPSIYIYD